MGQHSHGIRLTQVAMDDSTQIGHESRRPVAPLPCRSADSLIRWHMEMSSGRCPPSAVTGEHVCGAPHWTAPNASPDRTCAIRGRCGRWLSGGATGWPQTQLGFRDVMWMVPSCLPCEQRRRRQQQHRAAEGRSRHLAADNDHRCGGHGCETALSQSPVRLHHARWQAKNPGRGAR